MSTLSTQPYRGTRDFYPEDMRLRRWMFDKWREVCQSFGYEEYDGPILEPLELFTTKTSEEIVNEQSYSFTDRGDRKVIMRPEMTPTVSRMVAARRQELAYPLRLFSIPNCFRYERPQKGRLREFWQLNADLFGMAGIEADVEIIQLADAIVKAFGAKQESYEIRINSRKLLNKRITESGVKTNIDRIIRVIDGYGKKSREEILAQLVENVDDPEKLLNGLENDGPSEEVKQITQKLKSLGVDNIKPTETLARGFDYYTDIVFEVFDTNPDNNRSMFGGGRYDGLVGMFGVEPVPTVGFGMGDVTLINFLESNGLLPNLLPSTKAYIVVIDNQIEAANKLATELRQKGINVAVDYSNRKADKQLKTALKHGIKHIIFVGPEEAKNGAYTLKNLATQQEQKLTLDKLINNFK